MPGDAVSDWMLSLFRERENADEAKDQELRVGASGVQEVVVR